MSDSVEESPASTDSGTLAKYETLFQHRFSDCDPVFMETVQKPTASPPCVENWYTRPKRTFDWSRSQHDQRGGGGYQRGGGGRSYNDNRERSDGSNNRGRPWRDYGNRGGGYGNRGGYGGGQGESHRDSDPDRSQHGRVHYAGMRRQQDDHDERQPKYARRDER